MILQFEEKGEKSGWTYIEVSAEIAQKLKPGDKRTFRVKGLLDSYPFRGIALLPMGDGSFIMPLNSGIRKGIGKRKGALVNVAMEADGDFKLAMPAELEACLLEEPEASRFFDQLSKSHQGYFIKWIQDAKTEPTRIKRIENTVLALVDQLDFGAMLRRLKAKRTGNLS